MMHGCISVPLGADFFCAGAQIHVVDKQAIIHAHVREQEGRGPMG